MMMLTMAPQMIKVSTLHRQLVQKWQNCSKNVSSQENERKEVPLQWINIAISSKDHQAPPATREDDSVDSEDDQNEVEKKPTVASKNAWYPKHPAALPIKTDHCFFGTLGHRSGRQVTLQTSQSLQSAHLGVEETLLAS